MAGGVKKKMFKKSKTKAFAPLAQWIPTVTWHMYWVASTSDGNADLVLAKWNRISQVKSNVFNISSLIHKSFIER